MLLAEEFHRRSIWGTRMPSGSTWRR